MDRFVVAMTLITAGSSTRTMTLGLTKRTKTTTT
ncbi:hypothetical protein HDIA_4051 [Hartmannibacter diazotrophicus]|uniref:Uncharacterized protein n=1 Tax=Hartmannibacter diazotrophicus TaxID=1482074 RepID=A0A2C9DB87_9HYPH|nr:hypothetical protein HDIA_4051 [Hartmannibacter diazotrophicus]